MLTLLEQPREHSEGAQEEYRSEVEDVFVLLVVPLAHLGSSQIHEADGLQDLGAPLLLPVLVVFIFLLRYLWVLRSLVYLLIVSLDKDLLTDLLQVDHREILNPDHL